MVPTPFAHAADAGTPVSIETALRRVRLFAGGLILARFLTTSSLPNLLAIVLVGIFWSINLISLVAQREDARTRTLLGIVQLVADTIVDLARRVCAVGPHRNRRRGLGRARAARDRRRDPLPASRRGRELADGRRGLLDVECHDDARHGSARARGTAHGRVPRRASDRLPRRSPRRGDRCAPPRTRRSRASHAAAPRRRARRATQHQARRRRDHRRAARDGRVDGLLRTRSVRALRHRPARPHRPPGPRITEPGRDPARRPAARGRGDGPSCGPADGVAAAARTCTEPEAPAPDAGAARATRGCSPFR